MLLADLLVGFVAVHSLPRAQCVRWMCSVGCSSYYSSKRTYNAVKIAKSGMSRLKRTGPVVCLVATDGSGC